VGADFSGLPELLSGAEISPQLLEILRSRMSAEEFVQLEEMLADGNELPLAAIFTLLGIDGSEVGMSAGGARQTTASLISHHPVGEGLQKQLGEGTAQQQSKLQNHARSELNLQQNTTDLLRDSVAKLVKPELPAVEPQAVALPPRVGPSMVDMVSTLVSNMEANGIGMAQPTSSSSSLSTTTAQVVVPQAVTVPPGEKGWDQAIGERILWMVGREVQSASVRIRPPNLGPLNIHLSIQNDQASVSFTAQHGIVKEALEAAIPRLREMLAESGIDLADVDVSQRDNSTRSELSDPYQQQEESGTTVGPAEDGSESEIAAGEPANYYRSDHLLDDYA
jgi:flagellar hook-length control protein FliK